MRECVVSGLVKYSFDTIGVSDLGTEMISALCKSLVRRVIHCSYAYIYFYTRLVYTLFSMGYKKIYLYSKH